MCVCVCVRVCVCTCKTQVKACANNLAQCCVDFRNIYVAAWSTLYNLMYIMYNVCCIM